MKQPRLADKDILPSGKVVGAYEVIFLVGIGSFGCVSKVKDKRTQQMFAMKTESHDAPTKSLPTEIECIETLEGDCFPHLRCHGSDKKFCYLVMNLLGASVTAIRRQQGDRLQPAVCLPIARQTLTIIQTFHSAGWVHRDIKPSNFLLQQNPSAPLVLIYFGLSKKYLHPITHTVLESPSATGIAGTRKYVSLKMEQHSAFGRRDDLESWFYSVVELWSGSLPWVQDGIDIAQVKQNTTAEQLCRGMPGAFREIHTAITNLEAPDEPPYDQMRGKLEEAMAQLGIDWQRFDWGKLYAAHSNIGDLAKILREDGLGLSSSLPEGLGENGEGGCCSVQKGTWGGVANAEESYDVSLFGIDGLYRLLNGLFRCVRADDTLKRSGKGTCCVKY
jgi:serine/threonine protein kinase